MAIDYKVNGVVSLEQFTAVLKASTLADRRPIDDSACLQGMLSNANLVVTAWGGDKLIGIARCMTDFHYACYLSDLAVDQAYQGKGVGKQLQIHTQAQLGPKCKLILIAAPAADDYYGHIGYSKNPRCWILDPSDHIQ